MISEMVLIRDKMASSEGGVIGILTFGGTTLYTLEPNKEAPFHKEHPCIPAGDYPVLMTMSNRFKRILPEIVKVPDRLGIRVHSGDNVKDTLGCILPFARPWPRGRGTSRASENKIRDWCQEQLALGASLRLKVRWAV